MPTRPTRKSNPGWDPAESLGGTLRVLSETWNATFHAEIDRYGVTSGQWRFLRELWYEDGITQSELAERVGRKGPTTGAALKLLVRNGFARREQSSHDLRKTRVYLTKRGRALEARLKPYIGLFEELATRGLSAEEVETFRALMLRLQQSVAELTGTRWTEIAAAPKPRSRSRTIRRTRATGLMAAGP
jgi:DNA-binding MarR family transcriptional regulator